MKCTPLVLMAFLFAVQPGYSSQEFPSTLDEVPRESISDVVVGKIIGITRQPETNDFEFQLHVLVVLKGTIKPGALTATVHYLSRPGISIKTLRSGLESQMKVGNSYIFLFGPHEKDAVKINLVRSEQMDQRQAISKRFITKEN